MKDLHPTTKTANGFSVVGRTCAKWSAISAGDFLGSEYPNQEMGTG